MARGKTFPGTVEDRGTHLRLILYCGGERHTYRLETREKKAIAKFARERLRELQQANDRRRLGAAGATAFSALLTLYERDELPLRAPGTRRAYDDSLKLIRAYFVETIGDPEISTIAARHVVQYLAWRRTQRRAGKGQTPTAAPISNRTLQKDRAVLHAIFAFADRLELREGNPVARVPQPNADPRTPVILDEAQYEALLTACEPNPQLWLYALALGELGARAVSEVLHLRFADVDLADGFIEIRSGEGGHRTKSGRSRFVPMTPRLHQAMRNHFARTRLVHYHGQQTPWVFHHERDRRGAKAGERVKSLRHVFDLAAAAAKLPAGFHRHDLRHRRVTTWLAAGGNPVHVKEAMGHSDLRTTMGYTHLAKEHLRGLATLTAPGSSAGRTGREGTQEDAKGQQSPREQTG